MNPQDPQQPPQQYPPVNPGAGTLPPIDPSLYPQAAAPAQPQQPVAQPAPQFAQPTPLPSYQDPRRSGDYTVDYLNSIAPSQQKVVNKFAVFGLIGGVLVAVVVALILFSTPKSTTSTTLIPPISTRIASLKTVTSGQQKHLKENAITETNAALNSSLGTMDTELKQIMKDQKLTKSVSKAQLTTEKKYSDALAKTLDDAYQRGTLDRIYTSQMTYELTILERQITSLKRTSKNKDIQAFCTSSIANIDLVLKSFATFEATK